MPIVGLSSDEAICRRMALYFGVIPIRLDFIPDERLMLVHLDAALLHESLVSVGDLTIVVLGTQLNNPGATNTLLVHLVGQDVEACALAGKT